MVTSGTWVVVGPFETVSVTREPCGAAVPCRRVLDDTITRRCWSEATSTLATVKPRPFSADWAFAYGSPVTSGIVTGFAPRETLM